MKNFIKTNNKNFGFTSCDICDARCCKGTGGTTFSQIILEDFENIYINFPILFIFGELGYIKPIVLLTNGTSYCKYQKDFKCLIYEQRPSICKAYPLSAHLDNNTYLDTSCPAVNETNNNLVKNGQVNSSFNSNFFENYQDKYINTHLHFEKFNDKKNFEKVLTIKNIDFFKFSNNFDDYYVSLHNKSLKNLDNYYFSGINDTL